MVLDTGRTAKLSLSELMKEVRLKINEQFYMSGDARQAMAFFDTVLSL